MKGIYLVLLAVLLCSEQALSLQCYNCANLTNSQKCQLTLSCAPTPSVCYKGSMTLTTATGERATINAKGCAPSCQEVSQVMQLTANPSNPTGAFNIEVLDVTCCEKDLCNGVAQVARSLWAMAGGLLLSLGPALLWALL
ncbi:lymphocyte antigen 6H-like isoform X1 [Equus quagga]|uniref:lymphocyte antigen 6H-like isoform X1 n=1 Tax=Equus quagga TaxID=89248 RepID=UPI001EE245A0|nr:lymphocyte antigen 6H-like isoform X1 [Equus quagga]